MTNDKKAALSFNNFERGHEGQRKLHFAVPKTPLDCKQKMLK